jgi:hypothetical protein
MEVLGEASAHASIFGTKLQIDTSSEEQHPTDEMKNFLLFFFFFAREKCPENCHR